MQIKPLRQFYNWKSKLVCTILLLISSKNSKSAFLASVLKCVKRHRCRHAIYLLTSRHMYIAFLYQQQSVKR